MNRRSIVEHRQLTPDWTVGFRTKEVRTEERVLRRQKKLSELLREERDKLERTALR